MYDYIEAVTKTTKHPPHAERDNNDNDIDEEVYNEELLRLQRFGLHLIVVRLIVLQTTDVLQWIAMHVYFKHMDVVSEEGKVVGSLTLSNLHNLYLLKSVEVK